MASLLRNGTVPCCAEPGGDVPHTSTRLHTMHPPPHVSAILAKLFKLFWAQKGSSAAGKLLRGLDLNQRPLGYEIERLRLSQIFCGTHSKPEAP